MIGEVWPPVRGWIEDEISTLARDLAAGTCDNIAEYKAICARIQALRDVLSIAEQAAAQQPAQKPPEEEEFFQHAGS